MMNIPKSLAVLTSGGLDSAILVADLARQTDRCVPVYVRAGLSWESVELRWLERYLAAIQPNLPALRPLVRLTVPVDDLYGPHWSLTGTGVPGADTPDDAVYLPGRNLLLTQKALLWCHLNGLEGLALGVLGSNPFPDASAEFFEAASAVVGRAVGSDALPILRPYGKLHKVEVMRRGAGLPLELSFSCIRPVGELHCGQCNKCAERRQAFSDAAMVDPTFYAQPLPQTAGATSCIA